MELKYQNRPRWKLIIGIILLAGFSIFYSVFIFHSNLAVYALNGVESRTFQMNALSRSTEKAYDMHMSVMQDVYTRSAKKVKLEAAVAEGALSEAEEKPCLYQDGAIVKIQDNVVETPKELPKGIHLYAGGIMDSDGALLSLPENENEKLNIVFYSQISGPYYYIEWMTYNEVEEKTKEMFDFDKTLAGMEKGFNIALLQFPSEPAVDGKHYLVYTSDTFEDKNLSCAEDFGITEEMISKAGSGAKNQDGSDDQFTWLTIDGKNYEVFLQKYNSRTFEQSSILACLMPLDKTISVQNELAGIIVCVFVIIGVFFLVWCYFTLRLVRDHSLNERQKKELDFRAVAYRAFSIFAIGCGIILASAALFFALSRVYTTVQKVETGFSALRQRVDENRNNSALTQVTRQQMYETVTKQIGQILENNPEYQTPEKLQILCDLIEANYIMLFDSAGDETVSNSRYVGLSLGKDPDSSTYDFRRLLTGTELITHELAVDEATGEENVMIGVSFGKPKEGENYGALLLAVPGSKIYNSVAESVDDVMSSLTMRGMIALSVDPETRLITHASSPSLVSRNALDIGFSENDLRSGRRDFFRINGKRWYVECEELNSELYFYAEEQAEIYNGIWMHAGLSALVAAVLLAIFAVVLLFGYGKFFAIWSDIGEKLNDETDGHRSERGILRHTKDPSERWKPGINNQDTRMPIKRAWIAASAVLVIAVLYLGIRTLLPGVSAQESLLLFTLTGGWTRGFHLFAFARIVLLFFEVMIGVMLVKLLLRLISGAGTKGQTIGRLLVNLANYGGAILFAYYTFFYLGFDPDALLASLGLLTFAVSLGAKDLLTDIIAGLSIVFEGEYQVGDIVDVAGYRGEILEIGVRTTKLEGRGGNIKIISNRDIKNVINMTRKTSWYSLEVNVSAAQPLDHIEKVLLEKLPLIGKTIPEIVSGPYYRGVVSLGRGTVTLSIIAECNEGDYYYVQRCVNRAVQELFVQNEIQMM